MNKKILFLVLVFALFIQIQNVSAITCTKAAPCVTVSLLNGSNISCTSGSCGQIFVVGNTNFGGLPPLPADACSGLCYLFIEDCNGSLAQCYDGLTTTPDWNMVPKIPSFEADLNCANSCTRFGYNESNFNARIQTIRQGSRYFRACWTDPNEGIVKKCSTDYVRIHTYNEGLTTPTGATTCRPNNTGDTSITNRKGADRCVYANANNGHTQTPFVLFVDGDLNVVNSDLVFDGAGIDFNLFQNSTRGIGRLRLDRNSTIKFYNSTYQFTPKAFSDYNLSAFDRNTISFFGYSEK